MRCDYSHNAEIVVRLSLPGAGFMNVCRVHFKDEMDFRKSLNRTARELYRTKRISKEELDRGLLQIVRFDDLAKDQRVFKKEEREIKLALSSISKSKRSQS